MAGVKRMGCPIHRDRCPDDVAWSTINAGEALPGVVTPLTWSFYGDAVERAMKGTLFDMGVLRRRDVVASPQPEERLWDVFYGRAAGNLNTFRMLGDRMPGTSADAVEEQIFGRVRPGVESRPVYRRYPAVAAKLPVAAARVRTRLARATGPIERWWRAVVRPGTLASRQEAQATLREAARRFEAVMRPHTLVAMLCQALYDQLRGTAGRAGLPGLELRLVAGYGGMAETKVVTDLWDVSRGRLELEEFVLRHGYHGPDEGELAARVWRIDRTPLEGLLDSYRAMSEDQDPRRVERERAAERLRAEEELFRGLSARHRSRARLLTRIAARFIPLRGIGKAAFLQCVDVARTSARVIGQDMERSGELAGAEEVFMLTLDELLAPSRARALRDLAASRRETYERFRTLDIPDLFYGVPEPFPAERPGDEGGDGGLVTGTPVSPGVVEGVARVVLDPQGEESLEPGEILVCRTTDPSWASMMALASALVIDIGGAISHGAIVARELGIPCVIGTRDASRRIRTGDRLQVDGRAGEVRMLAATPAPPP